MITKKQILSEIPEEYRHFFDIRIDTATNDLHPYFSLFTKAVNIFCQYAHINKKADIFFNIGNKGKAYSNDFNFNYEIMNDAIHICYNNCIFFNLELSSEYPEELQVAMYLEELTHCYMNISDEKLVKIVVATMCENVFYDIANDCYTLNHRCMA
ncbi:hypothetical protein [Actinobacillus porcinus]|uniref:hypothetical protein n=1 Tax=Actinobacillus porcinus TaxID=51048 RepID=UPI002354E792|nr:hypothetical protein [Actinobacillus porcinus]